MVNCQLKVHQTSSNKYQTHWRDMDQEDRLVWNRVVERRRRECASLDKLVALKFLASLPDDAPEGSPPEQLEFALKNAYDIASDPKAHVKDRRVAFEAIQRLRKSLNESLEQHKKLTSARATSKALAAATTPTAAITTTNNSQDRTRLPLVPQVTAPASVPVSPAKAPGDASANSSEPSRPTVAQNAAVPFSPPLLVPTTTAPAGTTEQAQIAEKTKKSPMLFAAGARPVVNGIGKSTSSAGSQRTTNTSKSTTSRWDSTIQATSTTHSQKIAGTATNTQTAPLTTTGNQTTQTSTTANGTSTATRPLFTQTSINATGSIDRSAHNGNVVHTTTGAGAATSKSSTHSQATATGNSSGTTSTIPQTTTGTGAPGLFQPSTAARRTSLSTHNSAPGTGTGIGNRFVPAAPQTATRAGRWGQPTQTGTSSTGNVGKSASTAPQTAVGAGRWTDQTKTSSTSTAAATWGVPTTSAISGSGNFGKTSSTAPQTVTPHTEMDTNTWPSANRVSGNSGVSQPNAPLSNKNRSSSITADLVAAATTTAQVAADSLSDVPLTSVSKTKPSQQATAVVAPAAPPAYQQRSDAVVAVEKGNRTEKNGHSSQSAAPTTTIDSSAVVPPTILSPFQPPLFPQKRPRQGASDTENMDNSARNDTTKDKDRNQLTTDGSSGNEPPKKNPRLQDAVMEPTTQVAKTQIVIDFPPDTKAIGENRYSYSQTDRPAVRVYFHRHWPTYEMLRGAGRLFEVWEPYWQVEKVVASGVTAPVEKLEWTTKPSGKKDVTNIPRTVAFFDVPTLSATDISKISWGALKAQSTSKPKDGDFTLLLRMLPIKRKPDEDKKRANTHLWPIGTFIMINNAPILIAQRKQASHDLSKWEYLSHPLELSYHITNPKQNTSISMCCQDSTQFFYMVAVCSYKSPLTLKDRLLEPNNTFLHSLSMAESARKAMEYINKNSMISVDDDDNGGQSDDTGILIFSLVDPVTKVLMKTPVRGQKCKHWQCFDLQSFMEVNAPVSGGRWRCVCCEQFVNYQDLEVCGLTKEALVRFADDASATRDRVEFRADQTMTLLPPPKLRHNNKRRGQPASSTSSKQPVKNQQASTTRSVPEPIEIIDLD